MSTILKALRRLEEEKQSASSRPLREEVAGGPPSEPPAPGGRRKLVVALAGLWIVGIGVLAFSQWSAIEGQIEAARDVAAPPEAVRETPPPPAPQAPPQPLARERAVAAPPSEADPALPEEAFASQVEVVKRPPVSPRTPLEFARAADPEPAPEVPEAKPAPPAPRPAAQAAEAVRRERRAAAPVPEAAAVPEPKPAPKPAPTAQPRPQPKPAPQVASVPAAGAELAVERTLWHPDASRRAAFVALGGGSATRVQEGDRVGDYSVSEIKPTGIVFLREGRPVERKVGAE